MRTLFGKQSVLFVVSLFVTLTTSYAFSQTKSDPSDLRDKIRKEIQNIRSQIKESEQGLEQSVPARSVESEATKSDDPRTVWVRCDQGDTISKALKKNGNPLTIEVRGFCEEDVIINRDNVILHGADPLTDGVRGVGPGISSLDGVIEVRDVRDVTIENMTVTGGDRSGMVFDQSSNIFIRNCQVRDNGTRGIFANLSNNINVTDTTISHNGQREITSFNSIQFIFSGCIIEASELGVLALASAVGLTSSSVTAPIIALAAFNSTVSVNSSTLRQTFSTEYPFAIEAIDNGVINFSGSEIHGALYADNGELALIDTTQPTNDLGVNYAFGGRMRLYGDSSLISTVLGTIVEDFGTLSLNDESTINGNLDCFGGGDAFCVDPANVSGTSTCRQCEKP